MKAVFLDQDSLLPQDLDWRVLTSIPVNWRWYASTEAPRVAERIVDADIVVTNKVRLGQTELAGARRLELICVAATGVDNIDLDAAGECAVSVCNVTGYATASVVQHVFSLILALSNNLLRYRQAVDAGDWSRSRFFCLMDFPVRELAGLTMGIVGHGELGRAVGDMARAFGMRVVVARRNASDHRPGRLALEALLPQVDVLSLHCPLTAETRGLIGRAQLASMKPDALLINTARGGLVDEAALHRALRSGRLGGAGIDVLSREPPADGDLLVSQPLPNLIVTPHIAWLSRQARQRLLAEIADNIRAFLAGERRNTV